MFTVQNAWTWNVIECTRKEAWFWAMINETYFAGLVYNIYGGSSTQTLNSVQIAYYLDV